MKVRIPLPSRTLASGLGWRVHDVVCTSGPADRPFEEQHGAVAIAAVTEGTFQYRSSLGQAVLTPGAAMLGRPGVCFECGHEHGVGDRCIAFHFSPRTWEEIVAAIPGAKPGIIDRPQLPPLESLAPLFAEAEIARDEDDSEAFADIALRLGGAVAAMSPYHFLRTFRQVVGMAPHQYLLRTRLHRAALLLRRSRDEISTIAFESGFNDLSTFNRRFKKVMGVNPGTYRRTTP